MAFIPFKNSAFRIPNSDFIIMSRQRTPKQLAKLIDYVLSRRPDEFGLVMDAHGFARIKELLKAINEEEGFRYVRRAHLDEIMLTVPDHSFEISANLIRSKLRDQLPQHRYAMNPPKLLYTCVRPKAYPHVHQKGIRPTGYSQVILSSSRDLAQRIGGRIDRSAVLLTVQVQNSVDQGVVFFQAGETIFLADFIPAQCFTGPPLPKDKPLLKKPDASEARREQIPAGSYFIDMKDKSEATIPKSKRHATPADWKQEGRRMKKPKRKRERPPWRK
ncbi:RNA:NAD 2'-phosphotransferase [Olavius sp. associated proteobacterium Delta 1]|nr:RNA:NAD 2'-phosphotransferase [Olavius sp. associated proteobacterium Delta 1]